MIRIQPAFSNSGVPGDTACGDNEKPAHTVSVPAFGLLGKEV